VREQYAAIFAESEKWHALARHGGEYDWHEAYAYACGLLAVNYRIGWWEAATLGLIDTDNFWQIAAASFGMPDLAKSLAAAQKKSKRPVAPKPRLAPRPRPDVRSALA